MANLENGQITYNTTQNLIYMDSFIREASRFSANGLGKSIAAPCAPSIPASILTMYQSGNAAQRKTAFRLL
jgi:hypothetical protein